MWHVGRLSARDLSFSLHSVLGYASGPAWIESKAMSARNQLQQCHQPDRNRCRRLLLCARVFYSISRFTNHNYQQSPLQTFWLLFRFVLLFAFAFVFSYRPFVLSLSNLLRFSLPLRSVNECNSHLDKMSNLRMCRLDRDVEKDLRSHSMSTHKRKWMKIKSANAHDTDVREPTEMKDMHGKNAVGGW